MKKVWLISFLIIIGFVFIFLFLIPKINDKNFANAIENRAIIFPTITSEQNIMKEEIFPEISSIIGPGTITSAKLLNYENGKIGLKYVILQDYSYEQTYDEILKKLNLRPDWKILIQEKTLDQMIIESENGKYQMNVRSYTYREGKTQTRVQVITQ